MHCGRFAAAIASHCGMNSTDSRTGNCSDLVNASSATIISSFRADVIPVVVETVSLVFVVVRHSVWVADSPKMFRS